MKTKHWVCLFAALALVCLALLLLPRAATCRVVITQDGQLLQLIDLRHVEAPYEITIPYGSGFNTLTITPDTVFVSAASCASQDCVAHGPLLPGGTPIVCLPHRLVIVWEKGAAFP